MMVILMMSNALREIEVHVRVLVIFGSACKEALLVKFERGVVGKILERRCQ